MVSFEMGEGPHFAQVGEDNRTKFKNIVGSKGFKPLAGFGAAPRLNTYSFKEYPMKYINHLSWLAILAAILCGCSNDDNGSTKAVCNPDAVPSTRSTIDETNCVTINLSSPSSSQSSVVIEEEGSELIIKLKTDSAICLSLVGSHDPVVLTYTNSRLVWLGCLGYIKSRDKEVDESDTVIPIN